MGYRDDIANYNAQVNAMRQQKQQEEFVADYNQAVYGREESLRNRQEIERQFATTTDPDERESLKNEWHYHDAEVQRCEQDIAAKTPPPQPDPRAVEFFRRHAPFLEKYGQAGAANLDRAHQYLMSRGWRPHTQEYFDGIRSLMELYGGDFGTQYDPNDGKMLSATEAARVSGLSPQQYNHAVRTMAAQGRIGKGDK